MARPVLQAHGLTIGYQSRRQPARVVAEGVDVCLEAGQLVCLLGPNGAGKSTLLRTLAGMQTPLAGQVFLDGDNIASLSPQAVARRLSIVLTERVNTGLLTAYALVALGRYPYTDWRGTLTAADEAIVQQAIIDVRAEPLAGRFVSELSDGERQKIMIARALAQEPRLMLLDEPTAFLDLPRRVEITHILRGLAHDGGRAILLSTHDLDLALRSADVIWLMANGRMHIGAPEDLVLSGTFAEAFASEGVTFDPLSGAFQIHTAAKGTIDVVGDGIAAAWAVRALKRVGFAAHIGRNSAPMHVIQRDGGWELVDERGAHSRYATLADLTAALKRRHDGQPDAAR